MKKRSTLLFYVTVTALATIFVLLFQASMAQTFNPITNYHNGISIGLQGTNGSDYVFDRYYFDPLINDCGLCYIKSDVDITLSHNSNNSRMQQDNIYVATNIVGGDFGEIRYKVDKDWQFNLWAGNDGPSTYVDPTRPVYPAYTGAMSFDDLEYETGVPVVGSIGFNPGVPLSDRDNSYSRGMLDEAGNEYHYLTYADDDDQDPNWKNLEMSASDGKSMLFCVNPKTPAIWLTATNSSAQYYTTPAKVYWVPKIFEQISYLTDDVDIQLKNIMNSNTVYYRIDGGSYQAYSSPISSNTLSDGEHTLEFYYNATDVQTRTIIKNPDHPSKQDVLEDGTGHGYLLWKNDAEFFRLKDRLTNGSWASVYASTKSNMNGMLNWNGNQGIRNPAAGYDRNAVMLPIVPLVDGITGNEIYFEAAKTRLLNNARMHVENIGLETMLWHDPNPSHELTYRGYYDNWLLFENAFMYDILARYYRSDQYTDGITPIEDLRIRDMLALPAHESLIDMGGYSIRGHIGGMWVNAHEKAAIVTAMAMPSYNTHYYGTSGFDGTQATHLNTPYPDNAESWKDVFITYTDDNDPATIARILGFPNRAATWQVGNVQENGDWGDRVGYADVSTCGHGIEILYNVLKRRFDITYPQVDLFMQKSAAGTVYCIKDAAYAAFDRGLMINEYFPSLAGDMTFATDWRAAPYNMLFRNPDWANVTLCESTEPPTVPSNLIGTPTETTVALSWTASTHPECSVSAYRIFRNGVEIASVSGSVQYTDADLSQGVQYSYSVAAVSEGGVTSEFCSPVQVTTASDVNPPQVSFVPQSETSTIVTVVFNEDLEQSSAETTANYAIDNGISVSSAQLQGDNKTVILTVSTLSTGIQYTLTINNVEDLNNNTIDSNTTAIFEFIDVASLVNLALNRPIVASGEQAENPAINLVNGNTTDDSRWSVENYPQWAEIDLGSDCSLTSIDLYPMGSRAYQYIIEAKPDGGTYSTIVDRSANTEGSTVLSDVVSSTARYVKISISGASGYTGSWISLNELEVYGLTGESVAVTGVSISPASLTINAGQSSSLTETVAPSNATNKSVTWTSDNTSVATVDANGVVSALIAGQATITVTTNDGGFTTNCIVTVNPAASLTEYYCDPVNGSMSNDGSQASPWSTLEAVFAAGKIFNPGDVIYLMDGHHGDPQIAGNSESNDYITIKALAGHTPVVKGMDFTNAHKWKVEGIDVYPNEYLSAKVGGNDHFVACDIDNNSSFITFDDCHFYSKLYSETTGWTQDQWYYWTWVMIDVYGDDCTVKNSHFEVVDMAVQALGHRLTIENNLIEYITEDGIRALGDYIVIIENTIQEMVYCGRTEDHNDAIQSFCMIQDGYHAVTGVQIIRNTIKAYNDKNRDHIEYMQCLGLFDGWFDNWVVRENVIFGSHWHGISFLGARNCEIVNNTVVKLDGALFGDPGINVEDLKSSGGDYASYTGSRESSNNIVRNNISCNLKVLGSGNINENNLILSQNDYEDNFVDWLNTDGHLIASSVAINAGTNTGVSAADIDGNARIYNGTVDQGAYEYSGSSVPVSVSSVSVSPTSLSLNEGQTSVLTETVSPVNATDKTVTWSSSNSAVATVDANGVVSALSGGQTSITVATNDGGFTAHCNVTVNEAPTSGLYRALNTNGNAVTVDGIDFEAGTAANFSTSGNSYAASTAPVPAVDADKADMLKSFIYLSNSTFTANFSSVPNGDYEIYVYIYEDNSSIATNGTISIEGNLVESGISTGGAGQWTKYGPYNVNVADGSIDFSFSSTGSLLVSGFEIYNVVSTVPVTGISVSPTILTLDEGQTSDLTETISPTNATDPSVVWSSSNAFIATVDANGLVSALSSGQATITVTTNDGGYTASCDVTVNVPVIDVTGVTISSSTLTLNVGQTSDLNETVAPTNATDPSVVWSTSNSTVATVDANGVVSALSNGQATITVTTNDGGYTASCDVTVNVPVIDVTGVTISSSTLTLNVGQTSDLNETVAPTNATDPSVVWSTSNSTVATVDANGVVSALSGGQTSITVATNDGGFTASCNVTVNEAPASGLYRALNTNGNAVTVDGIDFEAGSAANFSTSGNSYAASTAPVPAVDADKAEMLKSFIYLSNSTFTANFSSVPNGDYEIYVYVYEDNSSIATNGTISVEGNLVESGISTGGPGQWTKYGPYNVTVTDGSIDFSFSSTGSLLISGFEIYSVVSTIPVTGISVLPTILTLDEGQTSDLSETISPTNATDPSVVWSSSNASVATVDANGLVSALSSGQATITATTNDGGYTASCNVTVNVPVIDVTGVAISSSTLTLNVGQTSDLNETVAPTNATDPTVVWSSSNTSVATVDANGVVSGLSSGQATITVTTNDGGYSATCDVTVQVPVEVNLALGKSVTASADPYGIKDKINDNDITGDSRWGLNGFPQWIEIDLGEDCELTRIDLYPYNSTDYQYTIEASSDGVTYTTIVDRSANTESNVVLSDNVIATARYVKLTVLNSNTYVYNWININELMIFGMEDVNKHATKAISDNHIDNETVINLYPNPITGNTIYVDLVGYNNTGKTSIQLIDMCGKVVDSQSAFTTNSGSGHFLISTDKILKSGIYIISINTDTGVQCQKLIVK